MFGLPQPPLAPLVSFVPQRQDGDSCFHNLDVLSLTSRHFLLSNLSLIFPIRSFLSKEEQPLQKRAVCLGCAPTVLLLCGPRCRPRAAGPARLGPDWLSTVGASSPSCLAEGVAGDGRIGPFGVTSRFSSRRSQRTTGVGTPKPAWCLCSWQRRKLSSHPTLHLELRGD